MVLIPKIKQWNSWSLPSKLTAIGTLVGILSLIVSVIPKHSETKNLSENNNYYQLSDNYEVNITPQHVSFRKPDKELISFYPNAMKEYNITYPILRYNNNTYVEGRLRDLIKKEFLNWDINIDSIELSEWSGEFECSYDVVYKIRNLLGIRFDIYWYGTGAAHGNESIATYNFNLINGTQFTYKDIFDTTKMNNINQLLIQKLKRDSCYCIDKNIVIKDEDSRDFYFEHDGITVVFSKYEVACGVCGPIEIKLYYAEIKEFINTKGPLIFLLDNRIYD